MRDIIVIPLILINGLGILLDKGLNLVALPAANIITYVIIEEGIKSSVFFYHIFTNIRISLNLITIIIFS